MEDIRTHAERPQRTGDGNALANLTFAVSAAIEAFSPYGFDRAFRATQLPQECPRNFTGVFSYQFTAIRLIWRAFEVCCALLPIKTFQPNSGTQKRPSQLVFGRRYIMADDKTKN